MRSQRSPDLSWSLADRVVRLQPLWRTVFAGAIILTLWQALGAGGPSPDDLKDKLWHFTAFYALGCTGALAFQRTSLVLLFAGLTAFGVGVELIQTYPPLRRMADPLDLQADLLGLTAAFLPMIVAWRRGR